MEISVVIPTYGSPDSLEPLYIRLHETLAKISNTFEVIFVDDACPKGSWSALRNLHTKHPNTVRCLRLSRNFGQHSAIYAGIEVARGNYVLVMDCDLEEAPETIPELVALARKDSLDIVFTKRLNRKHSFVKKLFSKLYLKFIGFLNGDVIQQDLGTLSLMTRPVVDNYIRISDYNKHHLHTLFWLGYKHGFVPTEHNSRKTGSSSYTVSKLIKHALAGILFQTTGFLTFIMFLGFGISFTSFCFACFYVWHYFFHAPPRGYTSIAVLSSFLNGMAIFCIGVVGIYIGTIFKQVQRRPAFIIAEKLSENK